MSLTYPVALQLVPSDDGQLIAMVVMVVVKSVVVLSIVLLEDRLKVMNNVK